MRITFVLPSADLSGGVRVVADYAEGLQALGHRVCVVYPPRARMPLLTKLKAVAKGRPWPLDPPSASHLDALTVEGRELERPRPVENRDVPEADIVIATWWETAEWVATLDRSRGVKAYLIQHDETLWFPDNPAWVPQVRATWRLPMHRIVVSDWIGERLTRHGAESETVLNGIDIARFSAPARRRNTVPTVGFVAATNHFKGMDIVLAAVEQARRTIPDLRVVAFGTKRQVELTLPAGIQYWHVPHQAEIPSIYAACDAWLFASRAEGFGLPVLEAMACRTPVIGTRTGAAPMLLESGGGILVPPEDPEALASAILRITEMKDAEWEEMSACARAEACRHSLKDATARFEASLTRALHDSPASRDVRMMHAEKVAK